MTDEPKLGRDVYIALAAVGWADGSLDENEAQAIVQTALREGLDFDEVEEIEAAVRSPVDVAEVDRRGLSKEDRLFVYAVASWIARLDKVVTDEEAAALARLGEALKIPARPRAHADDIARAIAALPGGDRPHRFDLRALRREIGARLEASRRAREDAEG
jgi:uncharacterized membrane protein YebE (DUF533 family)